MVKKLSRIVASLLAAGVISGCSENTMDLSGRDASVPVLDGGSLDAGVIDAGSGPREQTLLSYVSFNPNGVQKAYLQTEDGNVQEITNGTRSEWGPSFSPDGTKIVFEGRPENPNDSNSELYVANISSTLSTPEAITTHTGPDRFPSWCAKGAEDGTILSYANRIDGDNSWTLQRRNTNGSNRQGLGKSGRHSFNPQCSPGGDSIAYVAELDRDTSLIYVMDINGENKVAVTSEPSAQTVKDERPAWYNAGESTKIIFERRVNDTTNLYVINSDGTGLEQLTNNPADDKNPAVCRDILYFDSTRDSNEPQIYKMDLRDPNRQVTLVSTQGVYASDPDCVVVKN